MSPDSEPDFESAEQDAPAEQTGSGAAPDPSSPADDAAAGTPSLADILAQQKASMANKKADPAGEGQADQPAAPTSTPEPATDQAQQHVPEVAPARAAKPRGAPILQICLVLNTVLATVVITVLLRPWGQGPTHTQAVPSGWVAPDRSQPATAPAPAAAPSAREPSSWRLAERTYAAKDYAGSRDHYQNMLAVSRATPGSEAVSEYCRLRMAQCQARLGEFKKARELLATVSLSRSPVLRASASYDLAVLEFLSSNYLSARAKAFSAIAAAGAIEAPLSLETDSDFLIARSLTATVLTAHADSIQLPLDEASLQTDALAGLSEEDLRVLLDEGRPLMDNAVLGPRIKEHPGQSLARRYSAACRQAPLEELLQQLAVVSDLDIKWANVEPSVRRRAVTLGLASASAQRISEVACGMTGLLVRFTGEGAIIYNPHAIESLSESRGLFSNEAVSAWRRFFLLLRNTGDHRLAAGHFALGALHESREELNSAIEEYQSVATRFPRDAAAGSALLRGARLRIKLGDFIKGRSDLLEVLNVYPDCEFLDQVYVYLGQASLNAGILEEAVSVFQKLYHLNLSAASRKAACLGAARAFIGKGEDERACLWLDRYFQLSREQVGPEIAGAHLMMGGCMARLEKLPKASLALHRALLTKPDRAQRTEIMVQLAIVFKDRGRYIQALGALEKINPELLPPRQKARVLLARAQMYCDIGLTDKALTLLRHELPNITDQDMVPALLLEMAHCCLELGDPRTARGLLTQLLPRMKPGEAIVKASCDLAETCLAEGKPSQAVALSEGLLRSADSESESFRRILNILGEALARQGQYERAALAFSGLLPKPAGGPGKGTP